MFRQARWDEPLIYELSKEGLIGHLVPEPSKELVDSVGARPEEMVPAAMLRKETPLLPEVSEVDVVRHYTRLSQMNYGVDLGTYPLGSCTMKYNPKICEELASDDNIVWLHPLQDEDTVQGILEILYKLERWLCKITGMYKATLQPAAGAHGELTGCLIIRAYHEYKGEKRDEMLVPDSAHG
ncbi:MAG: aminomethyl-transferring glycine dehydrogenase subunit GcvPB, partial [Thermoprotei archaeon]